MTTRFDAIDLANIPAPDMVEPVDYEVLLVVRKEKMRTDLADILPDWNPDLESDPIVKLLEESAFREVLARQKINDSARATLIAHAVGSDLDNLSANFHVRRQTLVPEDASTVPPTPAVMESDAALKVRALLAWEALSVAGPDGAYIFHALSANALVHDVHVDSPAPGDVVLTIMSKDNDGLPSQTILDDVTDVLTHEDIRPLTDRVTVNASVKHDYGLEVHLDLYDGPDAEVVRQASQDSLVSFVDGQKRLGEPVTLDGLHKASRVDGVKRVDLFTEDGTTPFTEIAPAANEFPFCTSLLVSVQGLA